MKYIALLLLLASCTMYKKIHLEKIALGMSKEQVTAALHRKPDNIIGAKKKDEGLVEVIQYSRWNDSGRTVEQYWLYFLNDKLIQWGRPGDWEKEADKIFEVRVQ